MKQNHKQTYLIASLMWLPIWLLSPQSNPVWLKHAICLPILLVQLLVMWLFRNQMNTKAVSIKKERYFGLTEKLYGITHSMAMLAYTAGIWLLTPDSQPAWLKHVFLGIGCVLLLSLLIYFLFKKNDEKPDGRFYANLAKAACLSLGLVGLCLLFLAVFTLFKPLTLTTGIVLIVFGVLASLFNLSFLIFEKQGG